MRLKKEIARQLELAEKEYERMCKNGTLEAFFKLVDDDLVQENLTGKPQVPLNSSMSSEGSTHKNTHVERRKRSKRRRFTQRELEKLVPRWVEGVKQIYNKANPPITTIQAFKQYAAKTKTLFGEKISWGTIKNKFDESGATFTDRDYSRRVRIVGNSFK